VSRASRIPYHQNVYDLLQLKPGESPEAARVIADHETAHGPLPASVKEWYLVPNVVQLDASDEDRRWRLGAGTLWHDCLPHDNIGQNYDVRTLADVLDEFARLHADIVVLSTVGYYTWTWSVKLDGSDDPPVWITPDAMARDGKQPEQHSPSFSDFVSEQFAEFYSDPFCPYTERVKTTPAVQQSHANGLWLRTPAEPFAPPVIDFLIEQLVEPQRTPRPGNVTTYTFRSPGGTIRVTADEPGLGGALSAWWIHAETPGRLADLARLVLPFGTLRDTLRADTDPAREVLRHVLGERGA
jgi:hypothetical protein